MDSYNGGDIGASVYTEAKQEYTRQLTLFLTPVLHRTFLTLLKQAQEEEQNPKRHLWKFQELLSQIPEWNIDKVQRETTRIATETNCDYLEDLVTAVFIAHTKVLTAIRLGHKNKKVQITIPKLDHFLHRALSETSRLLWSSAYLFQNDVSPIDRQKNHQQVGVLIENGIAQAIRGLLPVKNILKDCFNEVGGEDEAEAEGDVEEEEKEEKEEEKVEEKEKEEKNIVEEPVPEPIVKVEEMSNRMEESNIQEIVKIAEIAPEVVSQPVSETTAPLNAESTAQLASEPIAQPTAQPESQAPTIVVDTEPTVRFTDFDQVFQPGPQGEVKMSYAPAQPPDDDLHEQPTFVDDHMSDISEFEVIEDEKPVEMGTDDYEVLG